MKALMTLSVAFSLAVVMGFAFYLTSCQDLANPGLFALARGGDGYVDFNRMFAQLGLGLLALGVCFTGAGPLSLDRVLFKPGVKSDDDDDDDDLD